MKKSISPGERVELERLINIARALNDACNVITQLAEDITGDTAMNSLTFDACNNSDVGVDQLLKQLGVAVRKPQKRKARR